MGNFLLQRIYSVTQSAHSRLHIEKEEEELVIIGIILIVLGAGGSIYGIIQNNSIDAQMKSLFENGSIDPGTVFIVGGAVIAVIGIVVLMKGLSRKK